MLAWGGGAPSGCDQSKLPCFLHCLCVSLTNMRALCVVTWLEVGGGKGPPCGGGGGGGMGILLQLQHSPDPETH